MEGVTYLRLSPYRLLEVTAKCCEQTRLFPNCNIYMEWKDNLWLLLLCVISILLMLTPKQPPVRGHPFFITFMSIQTVIEKILRSQLFTFISFEKTFMGQWPTPPPPSKWFVWPRKLLKNWWLLLYIGQRFIDLCLLFLLWFSEVVFLFLL